MNKTRNKNRAKNHAKITLKNPINLWEKIQIKTRENASRFLNKILPEYSAKIERKLT